MAEKNKRVDHLMPNRQTRQKIGVGGITERVTPEPVTTFGHLISIFREFSGLKMDLSRSRVIGTNRPCPFMHHGGEPAFYF